MKDVYCDKVIKVVQSIKTKEHAKVAYNYYQLWRKRYPEYYFERFNGLMYVDTMALSYLHGFLKGLKQLP